MLNRPVTLVCRFKPGLIVTNYITLQIKKMVKQSEFNQSKYLSERLIFTNSERMVRQCKKLHERLNADLLSDFPRSGRCLTSESTKAIGFEV